eukprot:4707503-Prymnesium_polylepis.1
MCAREQPKGDARSKAGRSAIAVLHVDTACDSALPASPVDLIQVPAMPGGEDASPGHAGEL